MNTKTPAQVRSEFVEKSQQAKYNSMLSNCSPLEVEIVKTLEMLDYQSSGQLNRLTAIYNNIKVRSSMTKILQSVVNKKRPDSKDK